MPIQVLYNQATMAMVGFVFTTEETAILDQFFTQGMFDVSFYHELYELIFVSFPRDDFFPVGVKNMFRWSQIGHM